MRPLFVALVIAGALSGQGTEKDALGRGTPQDSIFHFLQACHSRDYNRALHYLNLHRILAAQRIQQGQDLARQLEELLDRDNTFDITMLSREPDGDQFDGLAPGLERLDTFRVDGQVLELQLERVALKPGFNVWLVSAESAAMIPKTHQLARETPFEKSLPQLLVTLEIFDTPVWRWIALIAMALVLWLVAGMLSKALVVGLRPLVQRIAKRTDETLLREFIGPLRLAVAVAAFRAVMELAAPSAIPRLFLERGVALLFSLAVAWIGAVIVDLAAERILAGLNPRDQAVSYSVLPLGRQIVKLTLFLVAVMLVISAWGYNTSTILAGLGVGGLAIALAAQKTIENLFGGVSVIGDRPVLVGDVCRFGDRTGTIMHIGLRSTSIRTADRTVVSVPNAQFSAMTLENLSRRDKLLFHPTLNLRRDTTSEQLLQVLKSLHEILTGHPKFEIGPMPVRFVGVGQYSLDVEVFAYVLTPDGDEFLALQQEALIRMLQAVEHAGASLAVPLQESFAMQR